MADRRMFTKKITEADPFTEMPPTTQCLYFHLCMTADDDGFSNNIRQSLFNSHATTEDFNTLVRKKFIIPFESGVIVIKHWKMHNYIQNDRYHETGYLEEKAQLVLKENSVYSLDTECIQNGYILDTEVRLGKDRLVEDSIGKDSIGEVSAETATKKERAVRHKYGEYQHVMLTDDQYERLRNDFGDDWLHRAIKILDEYIQTSHKKYHDHNLVLRGWVKNRIAEEDSKSNSSFKQAPNQIDAILEDMKNW